MISLPKPPARGEEGDLTYAVSAIPHGLTYDPEAGTIAGDDVTYTGSTTVKWTATVTKDGEVTLTDSLTFTITAVANTMPTLPEIANQTATVGKTFEFLLPAASGGNGTLVYSLNTDALPDGLGFDANTRTIAGSPAGGATEGTMTYTVTDGDLDVAMKVFTITIVSA